MHQTNIHGVDHIGLTVPSIEAATSFFVDGLQATVLYDNHRASDGIRDSSEVHERLGIPATMGQRAVRMIGLPNGPGIELFEYLGPDQHAPAKPSDIGWQHLALYVDDIDVALRRAEQAGAQRNTDPQDLAGLEAGSGNRFVYIRTPWGSTIELITYPTPQPYLERAPRAKWHS